MGFIAMKALSGGLIQNSAAAYAYIAQPQFDNVVPIWGVQKESELDEFLSYQDCPPELDAELAAQIEKDKKELAGDFCRGCGYCMPCPAGIKINNCARMSLLLRRAPADGWLSAEWQKEMARIEDCLHCGQCKSRCPYGLDTPELLARNLADYRSFCRTVKAGRADKTGSRRQDQVIQMEKLKNFLLPLRKYTRQTTD